MSGDRQGREAGPGVSLQQHQHNAEFILESIMCRSRYSVETRDRLADALRAVEAGIPLRKRRPAKPRHS